MYNFIWEQLIDLGTWLWTFMSTKDVMTVTMMAVPVLLATVLVFAAMQRVDDLV